MTGPDNDLADRGDPLTRLGRAVDRSEPADPTLPASLRAGPTGEAAAAGEVLAVYSPKGGVGTSLLASRLALAAAVYSPLHTALVDLNPAGGDAPTISGVVLARSLLELLADGDDASRPPVGQLVELHPCGLEVAGPLPLDPAADRCTAEAVAPLLARLRAAYDLVVADLPARIDDWTVTLLAAADRTLLVTVPERPCQRQVRALVGGLRAHRYPLDHLLLLHNMDDGKGAAAAAAADLQLPLGGVIPSAPSAVRGAVNGDQDPVEQLAQGPVGRAVCDLARALWPAHMTLAPSGRGGRRRRRAAHPGGQPTDLAAGRP
jgi:pilus assembly protein CpaE